MSLQDLPHPIWIDNQLSPLVSSSLFRTSLSDAAYFCSKSSLFYNALYSFGLRPVLPPSLRGSYCGKMRSFRIDRGSGQRCVYDIAYRKGLERSLDLVSRNEEQEWQLWGGDDRPGNHSVQAWRLADTGS